MKIFAHRGYHDQSSPENTLAAFERAVDFGCDGIETDIRASVDGTAILFHDRCLADGTPVSALTREELAERSGRRVPTLEEALSQGWNVEWDLELKDAQALRAALPVLKPLASRLRFFVSSFSHAVVHEAVAALGVEGALLICHAPGDATGLPRASPDLPYLIVDWETLTDRLLALSRMNGFKTMAYGPVNRDEHD